MFINKIVVSLQSNYKTLCMTVLGMLTAVAAIGEPSKVKSPMFKGNSGWSFQEAEKLIKATATADGNVPKGMIWEMHFKDGSIVTFEG